MNNANQAWAPRTLAAGLLATLLALGLAACGGGGGDPGTGKEQIAVAGSAPPPAATPQPGK